MSVRASAVTTRRGSPAAVAGGLLVLTLLTSTGDAVGSGASLQGGGAAVAYNHDDPILRDADDLDIERPADWPVYALYDVYENTFGDPGDNERRRAVNVNTVDEVPDSSWFNNRLGLRDMSLDEIDVGPNVSGAPAAGPWTVIGRPSGGVTPKLLIEDAAGARFILKFDPLSHPEIASAAEMISSKLFYAAGYNVAEAYLVTLSKDRLRIAPGATFTNDVGVSTEIDQIDLDHWMNNAPVDADGTYRALASRFVPGEGVGEFRFFGTRPDDPNDIFAHEHRRELRGYRVFAAWLNHDDSRALNTYDSYVEENGRRFIKHYLLDFGSTLGSASIGANEPRGGNEYFIEGEYFWKTLLTLGIWSRPWLAADFPEYPAVGNIEAERFVAARWKPEYPNAAFDNMDAEDAFWAARIVSRFSDDAIRLVVEGAQISDPAAADYLTGTLLRRRDEVVRHWIAQTNPLDSFTVRGSAADASLSWDNAATRIGVGDAGSDYGLAWSSFDNHTGDEAAVSEQQATGPSGAVPAGAWGAADDLGYRYARVRISTRHPAFPDWRRPVVVTLRDRGAAGIDVVGLERPRELAERR